MAAVFLILLLGAIALGLPIAFALLGSAMAVMATNNLFNPQVVVQNIMSGADSFPLMAIPLFIFTSELMNAGGLSIRIVNLAAAFVGHLKGGLGYIAILSGVAFASLSGSAVADTAAIGAIMIPMMAANGYNLSRSSGLIATAGIIAPVLPPSIGYIVFGVIGGVSITKLFIAGIVPGLLMALALAITWALVSRKEELVRQPRKSRAEVGVALKAGILPLFLPFIIVGGLRAGIFTPTEAGAVAAVYALIIGRFVFRELTFERLIAAAARAAHLTGAIMFLVCAAMVASWVMTLANLPAQVADILSYVSDNRTVLMLTVTVIVLLTGTFLDMAPALLILTPILLPAVTAAGVDPVYFGVLFVMNCSISLITPPVGVVLNVISSVAKVRLEDATIGVLPFLISQVIVLFLLVLFPEIVMMPLEWIYS